jgi:hypothetical protein
MHRTNTDTRPESNVDSLTDALRSLGQVTDRQVMGWSSRERGNVWAWLLNRPSCLFPDRSPAPEKEDFPP